jgi:uncharacterized NAD(P)/FAD-binding protein YdhS
MVTGMTESEVKLELRQAHENSIHVITREGINQLIDETMIPPNPDDFYEQMEQLVQAANADDPLLGLIAPNE